MKSIKLLSVLLILALVGCRSTTSKRPTTKPTTKPAAAEPALTSEQRQLELESFDKVWTTIRDRHFDPKYNGVDWDAARAELRPRVENANTASEARAAIHELLERLKQTHFGIIPQSAYKELDVGSQSNGSSGIDIRVIDGHALVTKVEENSGGAKVGVKPGWELVAIKDKPAAEAIAKIEKAFDDSTLKDLMLSRAFVGQLRGDIGSTVQATFIDEKNQKRTLDIPMQEPTGEPVKFLQLPTMYLHYDARVLPNTDVGYIYISTFFGPDLVTRFGKSLEGFKDTTSGLVIDLRGNPGGVGGMAMGIGNLLTQRTDQKLGTLKMRKQTFNFVLNPQSLTYTKPVAILVDGCSGSTSEIMAQGLRDIDRARVFGAPTAGAALPSVIEKLPNGDGFQYAIANYISYGGDVLEGKGVQPDEVVQHSRDALLKGRDLQLEAAVKWIGTQQK
ncbi:MAG: hypothetical protein H7Z14_16795 [Anaerolineae bacterium]|nr:hypothetical protein [Phycisphaerae bacterium]